MVQFFCMNLKQLGFASQLEDDENVVRAFRRPFSPTSSKMLMWLFLFVAIGYGIWAYVPKILPNMSVDARWLVVIPVIFGIERLSVVFWRWYGNAVLMTDQSVVFAEWEGFFNRRTTRLDYWDLDDVVIERKGIAMFLAGVGDLIFQKINGGNPYTYEGINRPKRVVKILRKHKEQILDEKNFTEESALKNLLSQMVQTQVRAGGQPSREMGEVISKLNTIKDSDIEEYPEAGDSIEVDFALDDEGGIEINFED